MGMAVDDQLVNIIESKPFKTCIDAFKNVFSG